NKHIKIVGLAVFLLCLCAGLFASATQASAWISDPDPFATGIALRTPDTPVQIDSETLTMQFNKPAKPSASSYKRPNVAIQSVTRLTNNADQTATLSAAFITPFISREAGQHTVTADGTEIVYTVSSVGFLDYASGIYNYKEFLSPAVSSGRFLNAVFFSLHFSPHQTIEISLSYLYFAVGNDTTGVKTTVDYALTHSQSLTVSLTLNKSQPLLLNPSNFTMQQKRVYSNSFADAQIPKTITVTTASWMAHIGVEVGWLYLLSLTILLCAAAQLCWFIILTVRKKIKLPSSHRIKTSWMVLNCFCTVALFLLAVVLFWVSSLFHLATILVGGFILAPVFGVAAIALGVKVILSACYKTYTKENKTT
ncbi:MAG: hypothetical protein FWH03_08785, partial [Firmicutes bacterium]|nr:hypothetical protein [Bacillota bacterium]